MGNHTAGTAMGKAAELALRMRTTQTAAELLDMICEPYRGCDAEFEAEDPSKPGYIHPDCPNYRHPHEKMALGMLMLEAFAPHGVEDLARYRSAMDSVDDALCEQAYDDWWAEVCDPFREKYDFC